MCVKLRKKGIGAQVQHAPVINIEDEDKMWRSGVLGNCFICTQYAPYCLFSSVLLCQLILCACVCAAIVWDIKNGRNLWSVHGSHNKAISCTSTGVHVRMRTRAHTLSNASQCFFFLFCFQVHATVCPRLVSFSLINIRSMQRHTTPLLFLSKEKLKDFAGHQSGGMVSII